MDPDPTRISFQLNFSPTPRKVSWLGVWASTLVFLRYFYHVFSKTFKLFSVESPTLAKIRKKISTPLALFKGENFPISFSFSYVKMSHFYNFFHAFFIVVLFTKFIKSKVFSSVYSLIIMITLFPFPFLGVYSLF